MNHNQTGYALNNTLYYEIAGDGEPIILIHAGIANSQMWDAQWQALAEHYQVVRYDMRGYGRSEDSRESSTHRQDLVDLMAELGIEKAHLIGCSLGGEIALDMALKQPERVASLILYSATPGGFEMQGAPPQAVFDMIAALQVGDMVGAARAQNEMSVIGVNRTPGSVDATVREQIFQMTRLAFERGNTMPTAGDALTPPAVERLGEVNAPTLLIVGGADHSELHRAAEQMASGIPHAQKQVVVVENAAHLPNMEHPERFNEVVLDFLAAQCHA
jgi:pimeloyl-ACP methyl ester carboxylesterase